MKLADSVRPGEDGFRLLLNYRGKYTFAQEPCTYAGERMSVCDVMHLGMDYFLIAPQETRRGELFDAFEAFVENMLRHVEGETVPYTAALVLEGGRLRPILTIDHSEGYGTLVAVLVFGLRGETMMLGYNDSGLREKLRRSFSAGVDLRDVESGSESAIRGLFGDHEIAVLAPPGDGEKDGSDGDGVRDAAGRGRTGAGGASDNRCGRRPASGDVVVQAAEGGREGHEVP